MTSQIEKGLDEEALLIAQKAAEDAYMAEVYEGLAFDGAIAAGIRAYLTATGESKTESSPEVTEAMVEAFVEGYRRGMGRAVLREITFSEAETDGVRSAAFHYVHSLSVGREGAAQGRDAVRVKAALRESQLVLAAFLTGMGDLPPEIVDLVGRRFASNKAALDTSPEGMVEERPIPFALIEKIENRIAYRISLGSTPRAIAEDVAQIALSPEGQK